MLRRILIGLLVVIVVIAGYLLLMPVPIEPVAWQPPPNPGYTGPYAANEKLKAVETMAIGNNHGPEDIALDAQGRIYAATHEGRIIRLEADGSGATTWVETGGRPLGIDFDADGNLIVADAMQGLLSISPDARITVLTRAADDKPILYADDVDVAADGRIYFSDASTKFGAEQWGGTYEASLLDLMEHGGHGRLLVHDPADGSTTTLLDGLNFANGVAMAHDQRSVLVNETGAYRVHRVWLEGPEAGSSEVLVDALPGFPDNISQGHDGRYWVALVSPRNDLLDGLADKPFLRKVVQRLPDFMRPAAVAYGHIVAIDDTGAVVADLQDPDGGYPIVTSVTETDEYLYLGSLVAPVMARLPKGEAGL